MKKVTGIITLSVLLSGNIVFPMLQAFKHNIKSMLQRKTFCAQQQIRTQPFTTIAKKESTSLAPIASARKLSSENKITYPVVHVYLSSYGKAVAQCTVDDKPYFLVRTVQSNGHVHEESDCKDPRILEQLANAMQLCETKRSHIGLSQRYEYSGGIIRFPNSFPY